MPGPFRQAKGKLTKYPLLQALGPIAAGINPYSNAGCVMIEYFVKPHGPTEKEGRGLVLGAFGGSAALAISNNCFS